MIKLLWCIAVILITNAHVTEAPNPQHSHKIPYGQVPAHADQQSSPHQHGAVPGAQPNVQERHHNSFPQQQQQQQQVSFNQQPAQSLNPGTLRIRPLRRVEDTQVQCLKTHMLVTFRFSSPFSGYIYPHQQYSKCLLFRGRNNHDAAIKLRHGTCGDQENRIIYRGKTFLDPVIEHRLMIQWERDIVSEDDSSVIVRCDRPDDYNKTVEWKLDTRDVSATLERSQHPGPKMWMEVQRGEGPTAPPLNEETVIVGDVLTMVFTLSDNVYWFDSNIISCYAVDGREEQTQIEWDTTGNADVNAAARIYNGEVTVIEDGCSVKPKLFSHFFKEKLSRPDGQLVTLHYAHFKAFRFPTSMKVILQCNVQVCYKECLEPSPCSEAFHPRITDDQKRRKRREAGDISEDAHEVDQVQMHRSLHILMPEEGGEQRVKVTAPLVAQALEDYCYSPTTYYTTVICLVCFIVILVILIIAACLKENFPRPSFFTPTKVRE